MAADYRALGVARSLGRRGIPVWVLKHGGHLVASTSRYVRRNLPWPAMEDEQQIDLLLTIAARHNLKGWVLFPTDDHAVALTSRYSASLASQYRLTVPPWEQLQWALDKRVLHHTARELGVHQPWTVWPGNREELVVLECPFPVILKPATRLRPNSLATPKAWYVENRDSLLARFDEASAIVGSENLMVQEVIPGGGETQFSYAALCANGRSLARVVARRTRQYPIDFGQFSTFVETVDSPQVIEPAERLLSAAQFTGLVEIEFKKDPRNGELKVLDINPRVWGWHSLCKRAGVDFPYLLWLLVNGKTVPPSCARLGEKWMHATADLPAAIQEIRSGRVSLRAYLASIRGPRESAIFAWDDPAPGLLDLPLFACTTLGKRFG
jgi:predicted ATP-grasp superfamily ATP-dependent carboligase